MKKMQNVLYITSKDTKLSVKNKSIYITGSDKISVPVHNIESIVCFGDMSITTPFMNFCAYNNVKISFLSEYGRFYGSFYGAQQGNVFLRTKQYMAFSDDNICLAIAKDIILTKIRNSIRVLGKSSACDKMKQAIRDMSEIKMNICKACDISELRGMEGAASAIYFGVFDKMLVSDDVLMKFEKRTRRPPENNVNDLLSFVYTLLETDVRAAVECTGLDIQVGVMHTMDYAKPSLVLDMMEEYRSPLCDRFVTALINRKQIVSDDFTRNEAGIRLTPEARKTVLCAWQERKKTMIYHPAISKKINAGLIPFVQARLMSAYLRNEASDYKPFVWR